MRRGGATHQTARRFSIAPSTERYYEITLEEAIQTARHVIEEWDYAADPSGYCHERPVLMRLVEAAEVCNPEPPLDRARPVQEGVAAAVIRRFGLRFWFRFGGRWRTPW